MLVTIGPRELPACGIGCIADPKHPGVVAKVRWLGPRFDEGLRLLMARDEAGAPLGILEYVPGEFAWRPVDATGWLFVHCLWVFPRGQKIGGLGRQLIEACLDEARRSRAAGVAAMVSDGPWMAPAAPFLTCGFEVVGEAGRFQLVARPLRDGAAVPRFRELSPAKDVFPGLHIVASAQCPMLPKSVDDVAQCARDAGLDVKITWLESAHDAQRAPSHYGVFNLLWNGRLLADHYVSAARFRNILQRDILGSPAGKRGKRAK